MHIADVTHFIKPGTALDDEAANRGTTVYLTDKVNSHAINVTSSFPFPSPPSPEELNPQLSHALREVGGVAEWSGQ